MSESPGDAPSIDAPPNQALAIRRWLLRMAAPCAGFVAVLLIFAVWGAFFKPDKPFLVSDRFVLLVKQSSIVAMGAIGMTAIIIAGGIDLSVGALMALCAVTLATLLNLGYPPAVAVPAVLVVGMLCGAFNGMLITTLKLVPFIVTLGTMLVFRGLAGRVSNQIKINTPSAPEWLTTIMDPPLPESMKLVSTAAWMVLILAVLMTGMLRYTVFGRYIYAIGSNEATARMCGLPVPWIKIGVYTLGGLFIGVAGLMNFSEMNAQGDPTGGRGLELDIIAAVVIGGGSLSGGRGSVFGSLLGALTMTALRRGCDYAEQSEPTQQIVIGAIVVAAVALDRLLHRRTSG